MKQPNALAEHRRKVNTPGYNAADDPDSEHYIPVDENGNPKPEKHAFSIEEINKDSELTPGEQFSKEASEPV